MAEETQFIVVKGAREHNLQGVDLELPREALTTFTGVSGSGKSSLAYHTLFQEGQRRFLESLSSYARQFLGRMEKPKVDLVEGLSPTVSIDQRTAGTSRRSTVGTMTEVLDFLRLLMARLGTPACPECGAAIESWSPDRIVETILEEHPDQAVLVLAPVVRSRKGEYREQLDRWRRRGFVRARIDGEVRRLDEEISLHRYRYHTIELVVDRLRVRAQARSRLAEAVEQALGLAEGLVTVALEDGDRMFSTSRACPAGHGALPEMEPRLFSFNSPIGACPHCDGLGEVWSFSEDLLVRDPRLSVREGALHCITPQGKLAYSRLTVDHLEQVAEGYGFSLDRPWGRLTARQRRLLLWGGGHKSKKFEFRWRKQGRGCSSEGRERKRFEGIVPHLERVYRPGTARHLDRFRSATPCPECEGTRLNPIARSVRFAGHDLPSMLRWSVSEALAFFDGLDLHGNEAVIGGEIVAEIVRRLRFLEQVGLGYVTLDRRSRTLSGGEAQRIRLAAQVGAGLRGILYVLDEPSIGLHPRDHARLLETLKALRDRGNTVCVVEHDEQTMLESDWLVDVGPGAGREGGRIVASGPVEEVLRCETSRTAAYLRGEASIPVPERRRDGDCGALVVRGARHHNLQGIDVSFPLGRLVAVTGVSGSGKSTLVNHVLRAVLRRRLHGAQDVPGAHDRVEGLELVDKVVEIDQTPIGRTPRSNPATYTKVWDHVRDLFAALPESRVRDYRKGRFSFNVPGGRCASCDGAGVMLLEMQFLAPVEVVCEDCQGRRFHPETLEITFKGKNVHDVLEMTVAEALEFFGAFPKIARGLRALADVGLDYVKLGQPSTTLSGGEAQRMKLASELQRPPTGRTVYLLDEPTTGLHFEDIGKLLAALHRLVDAGNTVIVIEHNLDVVKNADWIVDLGPEGGAAGGRVVAEGTPEQVAATPGSHTGAALAEVLRPRRRRRGTRRRRGRRAPRPERIEVVGAAKNNLRRVDASLPLDSLTVVTGVSGSGKSSLAFDTLFSEGQRRFVESLSTYARRFLGRLDRAPVDRLEGIGPAIAIDQRSGHRSPRSTVATATEIHDYLRLLYARVGRPHCPEHGQELVLHSPSAVARETIREHAGSRARVLAPVRIPPAVAGDQERLAAFLEDLRAEWRREGFARAWIDGGEHRLDAALPLPADARRPDVALVVDRLALEPRRRARLVDAVEQAGAFAQGRVAVAVEGCEPRVFSLDRSCPLCGFAVPVDPHPRWFSFNHHSGACETCAGLGEVVGCDPARLVNHPDRPLFGGAIRHKGAAFTFLTRRTGWYHTVARAVAEHYGFDLEAPFEKLDEEARRVLLFGAGEDERFEITFRKRSARSSRTFRMAARWKGLCRQVEEWFHAPDARTTPEVLRPVMTTAPCPACEGDRLQRPQRHVLVGGKSLPEVSRLTVEKALAFFGRVRLRKAERQVAEQILREIRNRLAFLDSVGLGYLTLDRSAATLSGGEAQRIRLATQLGNRLVGVLYVLDEPTVGLHPSDTDRLLRTLEELRDLGNTVVVVEHDERVIRAADWVLDLGPGAGHRGGRVVAEGPPARVARSGGLTGRYLRGELRIETPERRRRGRGSVGLRDVRVHNLRGVDVEVPLGVLTAVTGVSGSGKSSLVLDALLPALKDGRATLRGVDRATPVVVDQSPIGTTPASNPATYAGVLGPIRELFARTPAARMKGFGPGRFSFNVAEGRCPACEGKGQIRVEMHFLADVWVTCEVCRGRRYDQETLSVDYRGKSIADVLEMEVDEALEFFGNHPRIRRPLRLLADVGLGYLRLGQASNTLSGGEAQRIKLVSHLARAPSEHTIFLLDEPTTGLHVDDVAKLVAVLEALVARGDTVVVIEHHLDVVKCADHVIELGPGAGERGGRIVATGTPEELAGADTPTAPYLADALRGARTPRGAEDRTREAS